MNIETEVRDIKQHLIEISKKIDELMYEREITGMMKLSEKSLSKFFEDEPNIYQIINCRLLNLFSHHPPSQKPHSFSHESLRTKYLNISNLIVCNGKNRRGIGEFSKLGR